MCIVVDSCAFASVFRTKSQDHNLFRPVLLWIIMGKGKLVFGGTTYNNELRNSVSYLRLFSQFDKAGKIKRIDDNKVDARQKEIEDNMDGKVNDAHLIAIIGTSGCRLICTTDKKAINPYLKSPGLYPPDIHRPKIYSGRKDNKKLLCDANIAKICKPANKGSHELWALFGIN